MSDEVSPDEFEFDSIAEDDAADDPRDVHDQHGHHGHPSKRHATVYDAVAGRVLNTDETRNEKRFGAPVLKHSLRDMPMTPDEVLFRRKGAPQRYAEHDIYYSHERNLPKGGRGVLPDSDMLKAIHAYSSHFYGSQLSRKGSGERNINERSMDETALLAFGILLEEAGREVLGSRGDLVFTEPADEKDDEKQDDEMQQAPLSQISVGDEKVGSQSSIRKRRRINRSDAPDDD